MRSGFRAGLALASAALSGVVTAHAQQAAAGSGQAEIHVSVDRVNVGVIVTAADGKFVEGLRREDFQVLDDGAEQTIWDFASVDEPAKVALLIEAGPAVYLLEGGHVRAAYALLAGLAANDEVEVAKYNDVATAVTEFSTDKQVTAAALDRLDFTLGFGSLNLAESIEQLLNALQKTRGKKTIVLLSTGVDTSETAEKTRVLQRLRVGDVRVLAVSLAGEMRAPPSAGKRKQSASAAVVISAQQFAEADKELQELASATGGRAYFPSSRKEFEAAFAEIAQIVRHEYSLGFAPGELDGKTHRIEVRVKRDGAAGWQVDNRWGYVAAEPLAH